MQDVLTLCTSCVHQYTALRLCGLERGIAVSQMSDIARRNNSAFPSIPEFDKVRGSGHALAIAAAVNRSVSISFRAHLIVGEGGRALGTEGEAACISSIVDMKANLDVKVIAQCLSIFQNLPS